MSTILHLLRNINRNYRIGLLYNLSGKGKLHNSYFIARSKSDEKLKTEHTTKNLWDKYQTDEHVNNSMFQKIGKHLDDMKQFKATTKLAFVVIFCISCLSGASLYFFREKVHDRMVTGVSSVASKSLEDDKILTRAEALSKEVLHEVLHDTDMKNVTAKFVSDILTTSATKQAAASLLLSVLQDETLISYISKTLKTILHDILSDDTTKQIVASKMVAILQEDVLKTAMRNFISDLVSNPEVQQLLVLFLKKVLQSPDVTDQAEELGRNITSEIIANKSIQQKAGAAFWSTVKYSVTPNIIARQTTSQEDRKSGKQQ